MAGPSASSHCRAYAGMRKASAPHPRPVSRNLPSLAVVSSSRRQKFITTQPDLGGSPHLTSPRLQVPSAGTELLCTGGPEATGVRPSSVGLWRESLQAQVQYAQPCLCRTWVPVSWLAAGCAAQVLAFRGACPLGSPRRPLEHSPHFAASSLNEFPAHLPRAASTAALSRLRSPVIRLGPPG